MSITQKNLKQKTSPDEVRDLYHIFIHTSIKVYEPWRKDGPNGFVCQRLPEDELIIEFACNFTYGQLAENEVFVERLKERVKELKNGKTDL